MKMWRYDESNKDGIFKCLFVDVGKKRLLFCIANSNWHTKGVERRIPIWVSKNNAKGFSFFCYKLAIKLGRRTSNV